MNAAFKYISPPLDYVLVEILKNAFRFVILFDFLSVSVGLKYWPHRYCGCVATSSQRTLLFACVKTKAQISLCSNHVADQHLFSLPDPRFFEQQHEKTCFLHM